MINYKKHVSQLTGMTNDYICISIYDMSKFFATPVKYAHFIYFKNSTIGLINRRHIFQQRPLRQHIDVLKKKLCTISLNSTVVDLKRTGSIKEERSGHED